MRTIRANSHTPPTVQMKAAQPAASSFLVGLKKHLYILCSPPADGSPSQFCHMLCGVSLGPVTTDFCKHNSFYSSDIGPVSSLEKLMTLESETRASQFFSPARDKVIAKRPWPPRAHLSGTNSLPRKAVMAPPAPRFYSQVPVATKELLFKLGTTRMVAPDKLDF